MNADLRKRFHYFQTHGVGHVVGEHAKAALAIARADLALFMREGWRARWETDADPDISWMDDRARKDYHEGRVGILGCVIERKVSCEHECEAHHAIEDEWSVVGSLWGIHTDGNERDRRMFEAEVALEAGILES